MWCGRGTGTGKGLLTRNHTSSCFVSVDLMGKRAMRTEFQRREGQYGQEKISCVLDLGATCLKEHKSEGSSNAIEIHVSHFIAK